MQKIKSMFIISGLILLLYSRFVGIGWGLPYAMHPDERNMVMSMQQLSCGLNTLKNCFNPRFYAYGQFPLYVGYGIVGVMKFFDGDLGTPVGFEEATIALRFISAVASVINVIVLIRIIELITNSQLSKKFSTEKMKYWKFTDHWLLNISTFLLLCFSPYFIQFSHFGTTESLLMLFYSLIILYSLQLVDTFKRSTLIYAAITCGLALATKVSSLIFLSVPIASLIVKSFSTINAQVSTMQGFPQARRARALVGKALMTESAPIFVFLILTLIIMVIFSPHNFLNWKEFLSSMNYESAVGLGSYVPFYTRQFVGTIPILFQLQKILPYALGWPLYILGILGFFGVSWKNKYLNLMRFAILIYFIPNSFFFAKWSRFMAPIFPLLTIFAVLLINKIYADIFAKLSIINNQSSKKIQFIKFRQWKFTEYWLLNIGYLIVVIATIIPGIAYLSIYQASDVRFKASDWIYSHIPSDSKILSETANVVDIPIGPSSSPLNIPPSSYKYVSFNFYDLDQEPALHQELRAIVQEVDYIFVPSRRIFANHSALSYPILNTYYDDLKSGKLGFEKVAEFNSYPRIELFGKTILELPDEAAEETWTVFDHPVIRIYKRISNHKSQITNQLQINKFQNYKTTSYQLPFDFAQGKPTTNYQLLVADTPEKWEKGLMYVRAKKDIGGADGMIFIFPEAQMQDFWNKNTVSDLDIYWINGEEIVGKDFLPSVEKSKNIVTVSSPKEVNKVIEIIVSK